MFTDYVARVNEDARRDAFDRLTEPDRPGLAVELGVGASRIESDFTRPQTLPTLGLGFRYGVGRGLGPRRLVPRGRPRCRRRQPPLLRWRSRAPRRGASRRTDDPRTSVWASG